jgi:hypothetical protein
MADPSAYDIMIQHQNEAPGLAVSPVPSIASPQYQAAIAFQAAQAAAQAAVISANSANAQQILQQAQINFNSLPSRANEDALVAAKATLGIGYGSSVSGSAASIAKQIAGTGGGTLNPGVAARAVAEGVTGISPLGYI